MKFNLKKEIPLLIILLAAFVLGFYFYARFPDRVVTHWSFSGVPNGYSGRFMGAFVIPLMMAAMYVLFLVLPKIDPHHERYEAFGAAYRLIRDAIILCIFAIYILASASNLGYDVSIRKSVPFIIGVLFLVIGNYLGKVKQNWFMGVRTPWTLSSENIWNKTNRLAGWTFVIFGLVTMIVPFLPGTIGTVIFFGSIILITLVPMLYSYLLYRKENNA